MEPQIVIARRIAQELAPGMLVNLGIGIPTLVANYVPEGMHVFFQSENGLIGTASSRRGDGASDLNRRRRTSSDGATRRLRI